MATYNKDPDAILDYSIDWSDWLGADTISQSEWDVPTGITESTPAPSNTNTTTTIWLEGGSVGTAYAIRNRITTAAGRVEDQTIYIRITEH